MAIEIEIVKLGFHQDEASISITNNIMYLTAKDYSFSALIELRETLEESLDDFYGQFAMEVGLYLRWFPNDPFHLKFVSHLAKIVRDRKGDSIDELREFIKLICFKLANCSSEVTKFTILHFVSTFYFFYHFATKIQEKWLLTN
jgi:hypothetical protein